MREVVLFNYDINMFINNANLGSVATSYAYLHCFPDSKVHGANMGPIWGQQDPGGPHVGSMNFAMWVILCP